MMIRCDVMKSVVGQPKDLYISVLKLPSQKSFFKKHRHRLKQQDTQKFINNNIDGCEVLIYF